MSRELPATVAAAIAGKVVSTAFLAEFSFASGPLRLWTGYSTLTWQGNDWVGAGHFVGLSPVDETTEIGAAGLSFTLSGLPQGLIATALAEPYRNRPCRLLLAILDDDEEVLDAYQVFAGRMDVMRIMEAADSSTVTVQAENRLIDLGRPRSIRYTDAEQQRLFPGDLGLQYTKNAETPLYWGVPPTGAAAPHYATPDTGTDYAVE